MVSPACRSIQRPPFEALESGMPSPDRVGVSISLNNYQSSISAIINPLSTTVKTFEETKNSILIPTSPII